MASPEMLENERGAEAAAERSATAEYVEHYLPGASEKLRSVAENAAEMPDAEIDELITFLERVKAERAGGSVEDAEAGEAAEETAAEGGVESAAETIAELTAQIRDYEGDRTGLAALVRQLGEANVDNPGFIDGTSASTISAERMATAIESGFGMNVSMGEAQSAAVRVYEAEARAAAPAAETVSEAVDEPAEAGVESVETVESIKAEIEAYNGDLEGLADLVRKMGAANPANPGYIDGTASGSISADRAASAIERGFGHNVSFPAAQEAARRIMMRDGQLQG